MGVWCEVIVLQYYSIYNFFLRKCLLFILFRPTDQIYKKYWKTIHKNGLLKRFNLFIADINSAPTLTNLPLSSPISVSENSGLGMSVFQVSYSDIDTSDTHVILATFSPSSGGSIFTVDSTSTKTFIQTNWKCIKLAK